MKRILATLALALVLIAVPTPAAADYGSGSYTTSDGMSCHWNGSGTLYNVDCSGYSWQARQFVSYNCSVTRFGTMQSWNCRSTDGRTWSGSN